MKKLLTLLGSVSLTATTATMAVACGTDYDIKEDGNSVLIQFLQSIDGKAKITSTDILWKLINSSNGPKNREKLTLDLLKMINLSILANIDSEENEFTIDEDNLYTNYDLKNTLKERWTNLISIVDRQIVNEKDVYKKKNGKKWEKEWNKMLVDKYSVYQDDVKSMDKNFLENKYKADLLLTDTNNNASKTLLDVLINTDQTGVTWISSNDIIKKYNALKKVINDNKDNEATIASYLRADLDQIAQIKNSTQNDTNKWEETKLTNESSDADIVAAAKEVSDIDISKILNDTPVNLNKFTISDSNNSRAGFLSNSQKFFLDRFYNTQAPLAISEVVVPFSENGSFDNGVTVSDFESLDGNDQKNTNELLAQISTDDSINTWRRWMVEGKTDKHPKATVKKYDKLMTLSNSSDFSQDMRAVVYDFIFEGNNGKAITTAPSVDQGLATLIKDISRENKANNKFYVFNENQGRVYYVDSTGLHIVQIDGYEFLKESESAEKVGMRQEGIIENKINKETLAELNEFKKYNALQDTEKVAVLQTSRSDTYAKLNKTVVNPYLHYLTNSSMLKGVTGSATSFDIMSEVKTWAQVSSSTDGSASYWMTSVFDYFKTISKSKQEDSSFSQEDFINNYITFNISEEKSQEEEVIAKTQSWFYAAVNSKQSLTAINPAILFIEASEKWTDEIKTKTDASGYPKLLLDNSAYKEDIVSKTIEMFWKPKTSSETTGDMILDNNLKSVVFDYNSIIKNIETSYLSFKKGGSKQWKNY
ncbi:lipoprotein [Spiroplasma endosymbiont of Cantharis nigra]|uniref:lipoprotein n=1 Tax=Spiroplasma endosymbiont of Cantharis nigra TaxID=3066278 RepID=UPI0030D5A893